MPSFKRSLTLFLFSFLSFFSPEENNKNDNNDNNNKDKKREMVYLSKDEQILGQTPEMTLAPTLQGEWGSTLVESLVSWRIPKH